jgi:hypothetical protein
LDSRHVLEKLFVAVFVVVPLVAWPFQQSYHHVAAEARLENSWKKNLASMGNLNTQSNLHVVERFERSVSFCCHRKEPRKAAL